MVQLLLPVRIFSLPGHVISAASLAAAFPCLFCTRPVVHLLMMAGLKRAITSDRRRLMACSLSALSSGILEALFEQAAGIFLVGKS